MRRLRLAPVKSKADAHDAIVVTGANGNNLWDVSVTIPKRRITVFAGVSGSGKSSLVFDTIAVESQRLINETYSSFVQGFMPSMTRPDVVGLEGMTAAIVVDQSALGANVRSTVGTEFEFSDTPEGAKWLGRPVPDHGDTGPGYSEGPVLPHFRAAAPQRAHGVHARVADRRYVGGRPPQD